MAAVKVKVAAVVMDGSAIDGGAGSHVANGGLGGDLRDLWVDDLRYPVGGRRSSQ